MYIEAHTAVSIPAFRDQAGVGAEEALDLSILLPAPVEGISHGVECNPYGASGAIRGPGPRESLYIFTMPTGTKSACTHLDQIRKVTPGTQGCEECLKSGDKWVHLRMCLVCGHVGCCDSSKGKHATEHFHATGHPIMQSFEPGEDWKWCYVDEMMVK